MVNLLADEVELKIDQHESQPNARDYLPHCMMFQMHPGPAQEGK